MMPPQLARADRRRKAEPRPLVELTPRIDIHDLCRWKVFPNDWHVHRILEMPFRYPWAKNLIISRQNIEINHVLGYTQRIGIHWIRTGFGHPRPVFICECGYGVRRLFHRHGHLACKHCYKLTYASRVLDKRTRPTLQAIRLRNFLELKSGMSKRNRQRIKARIPTAITKELKGKRLAHHRIPIPFSNYGTRGAMHWL